MFFDIDKVSKHIPDEERVLLPVNNKMIHN
jgi:hypothetical protein